MCKTRDCWGNVTHCNTLQHTATHCSTLQHSAAHCKKLKHTATHSIPCNIESCSHHGPSRISSIFLQKRLIFPPKSPIFLQTNVAMLYTEWPKSFSQKRNTPRSNAIRWRWLSARTTDPWKHTATHCQTLPHTATHCNIHSIRNESLRHGPLNCWILQ